MEVELHIKELVAAIRAKREKESGFKAMNRTVGELRARLRFSADAPPKNGACAWDYEGLNLKQRSPI